MNLIHVPIPRTQMCHYPGNSGLYSNSPVIYLFMHASIRNVGNFLAIVITFEVCLQQLCSFVSYIRIFYASLRICMISWLWTGQLLPL